MEEMAAPSLQVPPEVLCVALEDSMKCTVSRLCLSDETLLSPHFPSSPHWIPILEGSDATVMEQGEARQYQVLKKRKRLVTPPQPLPALCKWPWWPSFAKIGEEMKLEDLIITGLDNLNY